MNTLTGRVLRPSDPGWDEARKGFNQRFDLQPQLIVFCQNNHDIRNALLYAKEHNIPFRVRSGRHNYEAYSSIEQGLVIDVSDMNQIQINNQTNVVSIQAGAYMLACSEALAASGLTLPLATGPTVGIAGLTLGGGFGLNSRKYGLTCDNLLGFEMINADGSLLHVSPKSHPDLFWACRGGGGGNFGIVTHFHFQAHPASLVAAFIAQWDWTQFTALVNAWQNWIHTIDDGITTALQLNSAKAIKLYGIYTPDQPKDLERVQALLAPLLEAVPPLKAPSIETVPFNIANRMFYGEAGLSVSPTDPMWSVQVHHDQQPFKSSSAAAMQPFDNRAIQIMLENLESVPALSVPAVQPSMVQLLGGGGAAARVPLESTAVYLRQARFIVQFDAFWAADTDAPKTMNWLKQFRQALSPHTVGAYVNYVDSNLDDYLFEYYGFQLEKLKQVKRRYDPNNVFSFPQSIQLD